MNILQLSKFYKPYNGGIESVVSDLAEGLSKYGHVVTVLATDNANSPKYEIINSVKVYRAKEWFSFAKVSVAPSYFLNVIRNYAKSDVVHIHMPNPLANMACLFASFFCKNKCKIIVHWHSDIIKQKRLLMLYGFFVNRLLNKCDKIIVTSKVYLDYSLQLKKFTSKCLIVPIGIDSLKNSIMDELVNGIKSKYNGKKIVFALGRHIYYKGFEYLIEAAGKTNDNVVFILGGQGPDTEKYKKLIIKNKLEDRFFLVGKINEKELASYFKACDVFCFPSVEKSEAFGVVQLEAMSVGVPVISTNICGSGVPWVNKHLTSGLICEPKSVDSLSQALDQILSDESLLERLSDGALLRYEEIFTKDSMIEMTEKIYKNLRG